MANQIGSSGITDFSTLKKSLFLGLCLTFFPPYSTAASAQIISLNISKGTITEVFKAIEDQSEFKFFYNDNQINPNKRVDVNINGESIEQVLDDVF